MFQVLQHAFIIWLAYGFSGGEKEIDGNMIMDSQAINRTFELLNILPDTPESEIAEAVATAFEAHFGRQLLDH